MGNLVVVGCLGGAYQLFGDGGAARGQRVDHLAELTVSLKGLLEPGRLGRQSVAVLLFDNHVYIFTERIET